MIYSLPVIDKEPVSLPHFPTRHQAFIFRAYEYVPAEKIAEILNTSTENIKKAATEMGLPSYNPGNLWLTRGYITIIRRMWHILPYEQLLSLLDMDEETLAVILREEDFLDIKLSNKPLCTPVTWRELTDEEKLRTQVIKEVMQSLDLSGKGPFEFEYNVPNIHFEGAERFSTRIIYAFSGLYQHAFEIDSEKFLPDELLKAYQALGINGIWTQGVLSQLAPFPFDPKVSAGYQDRIQKMRLMTERLARYGIKLYLYLNEPRSMPLAFYKNHPDLRGHIRGGDASLCTSTEAVQNYLKDSVESICRAVPLIGGFFTITMSENQTNCYSRAAGNCSCPRCKEKSIGEVISGVMQCFLDGARRVSDEIKIFAWSWEWGTYGKDIIEHLPKGIILMAQSEMDIPFDIGGIRGHVSDYSMSIPGPGEHAKEQWAQAQSRGLEIAAKVQINTTWEASTVPALPVSPTIEQHIQQLGQEGVTHLLLSWTLGGYPCRNIATAAKFFFEKVTVDTADANFRKAEEYFCKAFSEFPFHVQVLYRGPQNAGPSNLLYETPSGYRSTMTCFAYDDLERWRGIYPVDVFESQFDKLCKTWMKGLNLLADSDDSEGAIMAWAAYCLFRSSLNQIRFVRARDDGRKADAIEEAKNELSITKKMLTLMNKNAAIGYEAANHYYFSKGQLAEKIINCNYIIEAFSKA